ncbi:MinD superfamily P-loop ATPase [Thermodesulfovibrio aggregans]|uniref:MinD superfamily P-loop ATPase n=1 Tax=Thermodesulfovibrio aggregans TaxID=86166 RepID=A0A0U9HMN3_9BACT|nr:ATP-binding protein [Thermodesulfovibrio aggregans]GAQ94267.1 MinD superfamily P-loop ATPase [Thermodesulfovibrio aggregans]
MVISVASGKGGTGKTTVVVSLALSIENSQLIDCDVEEPNVHLFLNPEIKQELKVFSVVPEVDKEKCNLCGYCSTVCAYNALSVIKLDSSGDVLLFPHLCHGCDGCILLCPEKAMKPAHRGIGMIKIGSFEGIEFIEGRLNISEVLAPKVIEEAKAYAKKDKITIIDAPPGTSCPAVTAVKGSDFCILVTEPTPFGLHDLELAYEVTKALNIKAGVIINKSGDDALIEDFCRKNKIPVLLKIPFHRKIAEAYSKGIPLIKAMPEYKEIFQRLYRDIREII